MTKFRLEIVLRPGLLNVETVLKLFPGLEPVYNESEYFSIFYGISSWPVSQIQAEILNSWSSSGRILGWHHDTVEVREEKGEDDLC